MRFTKAAHRRLFAFHRVLRFLVMVGFCTGLCMCSPVFVDKLADETLAATATTVHLPKMALMIHPAWCNGTAISSFFVVEFDHDFSDDYDYGINTAITTTDAVIHQATCNLNEPAGMSQVSMFRNDLNSCRWSATTVQCAGVKTYAGDIDHYLRIWMPCGFKFHNISMTILRHNQVLAQTVISPQWRAWFPAGPTRADCGVCYGDTSGSGLHGHHKWTF